MLVHIWSCIDLTWKASFLSVTDKNILRTFINSLIFFFLYYRQNTCSLFSFLVCPWSKFGGDFKVWNLIFDVVLAGTSGMLRTGEVLASCRAAFHKPPQASFSHESWWSIPTVTLEVIGKWWKRTVHQAGIMEEEQEYSNDCAEKCPISLVWASAFHLSTNFDPRASVVSLDTYWSRF